jgi:uncharacterized membrane protein
VSNTPDPRRAPGLLLGIGLGGFVDGILLHQLLQWHHMVSAVAGSPADTVAGLQVDTFWDGVFHVGTWIAVAAGTFLLWRRSTHSSWTADRGSLLGWMIVGWGVFNIVEGVVNHQLSGIHHVRDDLGGPLSWDIGFLAFGAVVTIIGWAIVRTGHDQEDAARATEVR